MQEEKANQRIEHIREETIERGGYGLYRTAFEHDSCAERKVRTP